MSEIALCECGCERNANLKVCNYSGSCPDLSGADYYRPCAGDTDYEYTAMLGRIRARRAAQAEPRDTAPCPPPDDSAGMREGCIVTIDVPAPTGVQIFGTLRLVDEPTPPPCRSCSSPATDGAYCVYCKHREFHEPKSNLIYVDTDERNVAARARLAAMERAQSPRETATSRELAKAHPSLWPSQEGEE